MACALRGKSLIEMRDPKATQNLVLLAFAGVLLVTSRAYAGPPSVTTQMYNNTHQDWNPNETTLTVANVTSSFQLLFKDTTDDGTYSQPLYVPALTVGGATHNVIFLATENNSVYAFDADTAGTPLWMKNLTPAGETLQVSNDYANTRLPHIGITGTPVIDPSSNTLYVVAASKTTSSPTVFHQRLHALDITTGNERSGSPVDVAAKFPGTGGEQDGSGNVLFDPLIQFDRAGLMLFGNTVYIPWSAHEDNGLGPDGTPVGNGEYQGWVIAYDKTSLAQVGVFNDSPNLASGTGGGSIWQAAVGMVADSSSIYALTANGAFDQNTGGGDYGDTLLRLNPAPSLSVADYFTPCNQQVLGNDNIDQDLGSGAPMILPTQSSGPANLLTFAGKEGTIYLINRSSLGGYTPTQVPDSQQCTDNIVQELWRVLGTAPNNTSNRNAFWGAPAYFQDSSGRQYVYYTGDYSPIIEYDLANGSLTPGVNAAGKPNQTPSSEYNFARGGTLPSISSNGGDTTTAILWAIKHPSPTTSPNGAGTITLDAFPANDLTNEIVNDLPAGKWTYTNDAFLIPTVVNGKVYVSSSGELDVFGISSTPVVPGKFAQSRAKMNFGKTALNAAKASTFKIVNAGKGTLQVTIGSLQAPFQVTQAGQMITLAKGKDAVINVQFMPTASGPFSQSLTMTSNDPKHPSPSLALSGIGK